MENLMIRKETERDYAAVENLTREAFWNVNVPGCDEHYLVHTMRRHEDFIPELAFVLERNGEIIGNVMYTRAALADESGFCKPILTFGPPQHSAGVSAPGVWAAFVGAFFSLCRRAGICVDNPATKCCENLPFPSY